MRHFFSVKLQNAAFAVNERRSLQLLKNLSNLAAPHEVTFPIPRIVEYFHTCLRFPEPFKAQLAYVSYQLLSLWVTILVSAIQPVNLHLRILIFTNLRQKLPKKHRKLFFKLSRNRNPLIKLPVKLRNLINRGSHLSQINRTFQTVNLHQTTRNRVDFPHKMIRLLIRLRQSKLSVTISDNRRLTTNIINVVMPKNHVASALKKTR